MIDRSKGPYLLDERLDRQTAVGQDPNLWSANLADLGLVYVHVHDLCSRCKGRDFAGHAVIKAAAERKQEVRLLHGGDSGEVAVHPGHPEGQGMTVGERATGHKGRHDGNAGQVHQLAQHLGGPRLQDAAARVDHRPFGRENERGGGSYRRRVGVGRRLVAGQVDSVRPVPLHGGVRDVFREVDEHRSRATGRRDVECLAHDLGDIGGVGDEPVVLCDPEGDTGRVALLEGVGPDCARGNLAADAHQRDRVHIGVGERGHDVGSARPTCDHRHSRPAGCLRVAFGHMPGALLVSNQDVADRRVEDGVVYGQDRTSGKAEDNFDPLHFQAFHKRLRSGEFHRGYLSLSFVGSVGGYAVFG